MFSNSTFSSVPFSSLAQKVVEAGATLDGFAVFDHAHHDLPIVNVDIAFDVAASFSGGSDRVFRVSPLPGVGADTSGEGPGDFDEDDFDNNFNLGPNPWLGYGGESSDPDLAFSFQDPDQCLLSVNGVEVDLRTNSFYNLQDFQVSYDGKYLSFSEIATPVPARYSFPLNAPVTLTLVVTTTGGTSAEPHVYFSGRIRNRTHTGINNNESLEYQAIGTQQLAFEQPLLLQGMPFFTIQPTQVLNYTIPGVSGTFRTYISRVGDVVELLFNIAAPYLHNLGIPSTLGTPGPDTLVSYISKEIDFENITFGEALKQVLQDEPNRRIFFDDLTGTWTFPDLLTLPIAEISIPDVNLINNIYNWDLSNRYTAVRLVGKMNYEVSGAAISAGSPSKESIVLEPAWDVNLELDWTMEKAYGLQDPTEFNPEYQWVYRRWTFQGGLPGGRKKNIPAQVWALSDFGNSLRYIAVDSYIDWDSGTVISKVPIVLGGNPHGLDITPGGPLSSAYGPTAMILTYWELTNLPQLFLAQIRVPDTGYSGTAYTIAGLERELVELVDIQQLSVFNALAKLSIHQDLIISGSIPIDGDPLFQLANLNCRLRFTHPSNPTGLETISGLYTSYRYTFGKRGQQVLDMTTDRSELIRVL